MSGLISIIYHQGFGPPRTRGGEGRYHSVAYIHTCNGPNRPIRPSDGGCLSGCRCTCLCRKSGETVCGGADASGGGGGRRSKYFLGIEAGVGSRGDGGTKHALLIRAPPAAPPPPAAVLQAILTTLCVCVCGRIELVKSA